MTSERGTRLNGKVAVVTGAGATGSGDFVGIGQAISILFARQGARVLLVDREERNAETTLAMIREEGGEASIFAGDVTSDGDMREMAEAANSRYGNVNVLINNVGISGPGSVTDVDVDFWDTVMDVNLKSVMLCSKHTIPQMIEDGGGSIVNLSSIVGLRAGSGRPSHPYAASKGGIIGLSNSMAVHYGRDNVRVNCIAPGHVHSPWSPAIPLRKCWTCAAAPVPLASRVPRGMWPTPRCSSPPTSPAGSPGSLSPSTRGCWPPPRWPCSRTCATRSRVSTQRTRSLCKSAEGNHPPRSLCCHTLDLDGLPGGRCSLAFHCHLTLSLSEEGTLGIAFYPWW